MFEEFTEEYFTDQAKALGEALGVDTRQGSIYMDAAAGHCLRAAKFMNDLSMVIEMLAVDTCTGEILEEKAGQDGVFRHPATQSYWNVIFEGTTPDTGTRFFCGDYYFNLVTKDGNLLLESELYGTETNSLNPGAAVIPVYNISGLKSCVLGELDSPGAEAAVEREKVWSCRERKQSTVQGVVRIHNRRRKSTYYSLVWRRKYCQSSFICYQWRNARREHIRGSTDAY